MTSSDGLLDPDMPADQIRLHMGEMTAQEVRTARAAIRWANSCRAQPVQEMHELEDLRDKVDGLQADLDSAIEVAVSRGAVEWARLNYPGHYSLKGDQDGE